MSRYTVTRTHRIRGTVETLCETDDLHAAAKAHCVAVQRAIVGGASLTPRYVIGTRDNETGERVDSDEYDDLCDDITDEITDQFDRLLPEYRT